MKINHFYFSCSLVFLAGVGCGKDSKLESALIRKNNVAEVRKLETNVINKLHHNNSPKSTSSDSKCTDTSASNAKTVKKYGSSTLRSISFGQYKNSLRILNVPLQDILNPWADTAVAGVFKTRADQLLMSPGPVRVLFKNAKVLSENTANNMIVGSKCAESTEDKERACLSPTVSVFLQKVLRKNKIETDLMWNSIYSEFRTKFNAQLSLEALLMRSFLSPDFLFSSEIGLGKEGEIAILNAEEMSHALSMALFQEPADETLLNFARSGNWSKKELLQKEIERLISTKSQPFGMAEFVNEILELETPVHSSVVTGPEGEKQKQIISASDKKIATDISKMLIQPESGPQHLMTQVNSLSSASVLARKTHAADSNPVTRGNYISRRLLCIEIGSPPPNLPTIDFTTPTNGLSKREALTTIHVKPACAFCHSKMDPFGFVLEGLDVVGNSRTHWKGIPIDTKVNVSIPGFSLNREFLGPDDFIPAIAVSSEFNACISDQLVEFVSGAIPGAADAAVCSVKSGVSLVPPTFSEILAQYYSSDLFMKRKSSN